MPAFVGTADGTGSRKKILVADDDPVILQALSLKLKSRGYEVITANDCSGALSATRKEKPDLMLLDVNFPQDVGGVAWNGFLMTQWLRGVDYGRNLPVIVMSANDRAEYKDRASAAGATAYLRKPIDSNELLASINMALSGSAGDSPTAPAEPLKSLRSETASTIGAVGLAAHPKPQQSGLAHLELGGL